MGAARDELSVAQAGLVLFLAILALLHVLDRRDPRFHFVSEYALSHPLLTGAAFLVMAVVGVALALALWRSTRRRGVRVGSALLVVCALGFVVLALFATDHEGLGPTRTDEGRLHNLGSGVAFVSLIGALLLSWTSVSSRGRWGLLALFAVVLAAIVVPPVLVPAWFGLHQRIAWAALVIALVLLVRGLRRGRALGPSAAEAGDSGASASPA